MHIFTVSNIKPIQRLLTTSSVIDSLGCLPFAPAAARRSAGSSHLKQVAHHGIDIVSKDAVRFNDLKIAEPHRQHYLHAATKHGGAERRYVLPFSP